jgi:hypothetical protein
MPGLNRKGPEGDGPRTGRGLGKCGKPQTADRDFSEDTETRGRGRGRRLRLRGEGGSGRGRGEGRGAGRGRW